MLALILLALAASACHQPQKSEVADGSAKTDLGSPDFRFDLVVFDLPLSIAERYSITGETHDALLGMTIDEQQAFEALEGLSKTDARVIESKRPACSIAPAAHGRIDERVGDATHAAGSLPGDHLELAIVPNRKSAWAAVDLDATIVWKSGDGSEISRFGANAPVPAGYRMKIFCLPAKHPGGGDPAAILAFLVSTPPTGSVINSDAAPHCQKCADDKKK